MCQSNRNNLALQMGFVVFTLSLVAIVTITVLAQKKALDDSQACMESLSCLPISQCQYFHSDFNYECSMDEAGNPLICCKPKKPPSGTGVEVGERFNTELFPMDDCGIKGFDNKIANGKNASIGQFPWMALLGYTAKKNSYPQYFCGGTLINDRYILTAAHCTSIKHLKLSVVRLGELNLETEEDCQMEQDNSKYCSDKPLDLPVEELITHEQYSSETLKNDIALVRLAKNVSEYTDFVKPICLPFSLKIDDNFMKNKSLEIAGWGKTFTSAVRVSTILQYTLVKTWNNKKCTKALPKKVRPINVTQICATGDNFQEACKGDSGGPLTYNVPKAGDLKTNQIGIVSFKSLDTCGTEELPTVFTKVEAYLDWIVQHVRP